jgi:two-component sensor histidine kinase
MEHDLLMPQNYDKTSEGVGIGSAIRKNGAQNNNELHFTQILNNVNTGAWEFNVNSREVKWSDGFYKILGYEQGEIECSYNYFVEHLIYHEDKSIFLKLESSPLHIRLLTKSSGYQWFEMIIENSVDKSPIRRGLLINIHQYKLDSITAGQKNSFFKETVKIAKVGGWQIDADTMRLHLEAETYGIYELYNKPELSIDEFISFFEPPYRTILNNAINNTVRYSRPFDMELLFRSAKNEVSWLRCKGIAIINDLGKCTYIKGIFQKIDNKEQGVDIQRSLRFLEDQNKRLQNFAYIVSHNLRSYTSNLKSMVQMHDQTQVRDDQAEIFSHIRYISNSLSSTIEHLDEIVKIQLETTHEKKPIEFEPLFKNLLGLLSSNIHSCNAQIQYDFSRCPGVDYIPAYMESIMQNLLTNSLKYCYPGRPPVIKCYSYKEYNNSYLIFEDNGIGIDMEKYADEIFGMYKTFHENVDAKGIGLFITRSQVESLGGSIKVESNINIGTKFTIRLT